MAKLILLKLLSEFFVNGLLAAIFVTSAVINPKGSIIESVAVEPTQEFRSQSISIVEYQKEVVGTELQFEFGHDTAYGPLQRISSISITDQQGLWVGYGFYNEIEVSEDFSLSFSFIPGLYNQANEVDLGGWLMFRSGIQLNYNLTNQYVLSLSFDHRSSGDLWEFNPGLETWQIKLRSYL